MLPLHVTLSYYKRKDIQDAIVELAEDREVSIRYADYFGKRPDVLTNAPDILELAKQKATSFHCSEERWRNPLQLNPTLKRNELNDNRKGWDLVLDIDCGIFEYSRIAASIIIKALQFYDIKSVSCKFSGNKGFHLGVPFEAFPETVNDKETRELFPEAAKQIALYIREMIKKPLGKALIEYEQGSFAKVMEKAGYPQEKKDEIIYYETNEFGEKVANLNAEPFLNIDTILIASRHLFRMAYSLHEKSGLVSVPINPNKVLEFERDHAKPNLIKISEYSFLDRKNVRKGEAAKLLTQAMDFSIKEEDSEENPLKKERNFEAIQEALPEDFFPPCIKLLNKGITDGKKRALFALINFLSSVGWDYDAIEEYLRKWNEQNPDPLRETYLIGQLRYHKTQKKKILPPNCASDMYYKDLAICKPDKICSRIKNPVTYAQRKAYFARKDEKPKKKVEKKEESNKNQNSKQEQKETSPSEL